MFETKTKRTHPWLYTALGLLLVLALVASIFPTPAQAAKVVVACKAYHRVRATDTLAKIAQQYKVNVLSIVSSNKFAPPYTIYVGQSLCIPALNTKDSKIPKYANRLAADFFAYVKGDKLYIQATNFPQNTTYYVRVRGDRKPGVVENKIALLNTGSRSNFTDTFKLPNIYISSKQFTVCLKNVYTSALVCRRALR